MILQPKYLRIDGHMTVVKCLHFDRGHVFGGQHFDQMLTGNT